MSKVLVHVTLQCMNQVCGEWLQMTAYDHKEPGVAVEDRQADLSVTEAHEKVARDWVKSHRGPIVVTDLHDVGDC